MEEILKLDPIKKVGGSVDLPGSKSISNRALLLAALSEGTTELQNLLAAEDTEMMIGALEALGVKLEVSDNGTVVKVEGCGGNFPVKKADLSRERRHRDASALFVSGFQRRRICTGRRCQNAPASDCAPG